MEYLSVPKREAMSLLKEYLVSPAGGGVVKRDTIGKVSALAIPLSTEFTEREADYLRSRGLYNLAPSYDFRSGGISGDWAFRIVIPLKINGVPVSATGRGIHPLVTPKYWSLPSECSVVNIKHLLYNCDNVADHAVAMEGPLDAIKYGQGGVALCGVKVTPEQIVLLSEFPRVTFIKDGDSAGDQIYPSAELLAALGCDVDVISLGKEYKDVAEMPEDAIHDLRAFIS
jgi:hypothetical protein